MILEVAILDVKPNQEQEFVKACAALTNTKQKEIENSLKQLLVALQQTNEMKTFGECHSCRYNSKDENEGYFCELLKQPLSITDIQLVCK